MVGKLFNQPIYQVGKVALVPYSYHLAIISLEEVTNMIQPFVELSLEENTLDPNAPDNANLINRIKNAVGINKTPPIAIPTNIPLSELTPSTNSPASPPQLLSSGSTLESNSPIATAGTPPNAARKSSRSQDQILEGRIKKEILRLFSYEGGMYYSYSFDLSRKLDYTYSLYKTQTSNNRPFENLLSTMDKEYWYNQWLQKELLDLNLIKWIIPVIQGFVQIENCEIDSHKFLLSIIARRNTGRLGMRYQRRGVNEEGKVANWVESEQIIHFNQPKESEDAVDPHIQHWCSYTQIRGSIPLFWSQSPYSFKPIPILDRSGDENLGSFKLHFDQINHKYQTPITSVSLTETSGRELIVGSAYKNYFQTAFPNDVNLTSNLPQHQFLEFDFHKECANMNYSNLSKLIELLEPHLAYSNYFWIQSQDSSSTEQLSSQQGVIRTNCMDCLDRTNVVQSTIARYILNIQLLRLGIQLSPEKGINVHPIFEQKFNELWANHGDCISQQYAGTSALKGDFVRLGKRNIQGIMNDATNSLSRFYYNSFRDFFTQAVIDYLQGYQPLHQFRSVAETHVATEPGHDKRFRKARQSAIDISRAMVIRENEHYLGGLTLLSPVPLNTLYHYQVEDKIVLLTNKALYICSFHFGLEKVIGVEIIELQLIEKIQHGEYLLSRMDLNAVEVNDGGLPLSEEQVRKHHYGLVIWYQKSKSIDMTRTESGSKTASQFASLFTNSNSKASKGNFIALKAIPLVVDKVGTSPRNSPTSSDRESLAHTNFISATQNINDDENTEEVNADDVIYQFIDLLIPTAETAKQEALENSEETKVEAETKSEGESEAKVQAETEINGEEETSKKMEPYEPELKPIRVTIEINQRAILR